MQLEVFFLQLTVVGNKAVILRGGSGRRGARSGIGSSQLRLEGYCRLYNIAMVSANRLYCQISRPKTNLETAVAVSKLLLESGARGFLLRKLALQCRELLGGTRWW